VKGNIVITIGGFGVFEAFQAEVVQICERWEMEWAVARNRDRIEEKEEYKRNNGEKITNEGDSALMKIEKDRLCHFPSELFHSLQVYHPSNPERAIAWISRELTDRVHSTWY
jgi:hypothetical protein